jgi:FkbM family methyltransferase
MTADDDIWSKAFRLLGDGNPNIIFDVGANHGQMARVFLAHFPSAAVYCFEPDPDTFGELAASFETECRVHPFNLAVAAGAGVADFHRCANDAGSSLYPRNLAGRRYYYKHLVMDETTKVATTSLDRFCHDRAISRLDLLKLDIQGGEYAALRGAADLLNAQAIDVIVSEFFLVPHYEEAPLFDAIWSLLRTHGYDIYDLQIARYADNGQARWGDAIFVSRRHRERCLDAFPEEP